MSETDAPRTTPNQRRGRRSRSAVLSAMLLSTFAMTAPAFAQSDIEPSRHSHMTLNRDFIESNHRSTDEKLAYVERMARRACKQGSGRLTLALRSAERTCAADLVQSAKTQIAELSGDRFAGNLN